MTNVLSKLKHVVIELSGIIIALYAMLIIVSGFILLIGWFNLTPNVPGVYAASKQLLVEGDADFDQLPDIIEQAPVGERVVLPGGNVAVGLGSDTNPYNKDSDFDLFPDAMEIKLGTPANNWFFPGFVWILLAIGTIIVIYLRFVHRPDLIKKYVKQDAEEQKAGRFGKGTSIFAEKSERLSAEERRASLQKSAQFHELTSYKDPRYQEEKKKLDPILIGSIFSVVLLGVLVIFLFFL